MSITKFLYLYQLFNFVVSKRATLFKIHVIRFILIIVGMKVLEKIIIQLNIKDCYQNSTIYYDFDIISWKQLCEVPIHCVCYSWCMGSKNVPFNST
jgi:hypothetical protein